MGEVFLAEDTKLDRKVALKFLPPNLTTDKESIQRFQREAKAAAALNHPNIVTIYEIGEFEQKTFIAMEYVEGSTLKDKIASGPLPLAETLEITAQICEGLSKAHEAGIVHRDIKPQNILIDKDNRVKILDFGLAKLRVGANGYSPSTTKIGTTMGTINYMSPEQAMGKEVDHRTDIWSTGVVFYEMITGQLPFKGDYEQAVIYSILNEEPEPKTGMSMELDRIVKKALSKRPEERYQNIEEIMTDLKSLMKGIENESVKKQSEKKSVPSIAVLPFVDMSPNKDQEYFCDGMSETLINALTHISELHVVARTSAFSFKGEKLDVREIGQKLNVKTVLEGSVQKAGNRLRITAQLIKVADGYHLWSEKYDRTMEDIFDIQDEISLAIVDNLKVKLLGREKAAVVKRYTDNLEAYNLYLKGRFFCEMFTPKGFEKAIDCFEKALQKDRNYAMAYIELGITQRYMTLMGNISPRVCIPKMWAYAEKALKIDKNIGEAHCLQAIYHMNYDWDWPAAEEELKQALNLNPNSSYIHRYHSLFLMFIERHDDAVAAIKRARELDPLSSLINFNVGHILYFAGRYDESINELQVLFTMNPNYYLLHFCLGYNYRKKSLMNEALAEYEKAYTLSGGVPWTVMLLSTALYETGNEDRARNLLINLEERSKHEYIAPVCFYFIHRTFGNSDDASYWLEKAYEEHDGFLCYCRVFPDNTYRIPLDPRLTEKLKKME
ncbi:MAG: protein kinase [Desulfobacteraceae bacterium]|nr:protein kinase [Desulfobacteraceae bacterium]